MKEKDTMALLRRMAEVLPKLLLAVAVALALYQVGRTMTPRAHGRNVTIDFLWPTYTPQKVRYGEHLAERYMELHPDVYVNLILTPDPYRKLQVMVAGRTTPDVVWMGVGWHQFGEALLPLDNRIANDPRVDAQAYAPGLWDAMRWRGSVCALPSSGQTAVIFYNKDLFDEAGLDFPTDDWTWAEMEGMARALTRDFDGDGLIDQYGVQLGQLYLLPFMVYDGQIADAEWREARVDTPATRALLERYQALMYGDAAVMPTPTASVELGMLPMFEANRTAMHAASGYAIETFRTVQFDWDIVPLPRFEFGGESYRATGLWQEEFALLWNTDIPDEAWDFAQWCAGEEMVRWAALNGHIVPGHRKVALSDAYLHSGKRPENMRAFIDSQAFAVPIYPHPWWRRISVEFEPIINQFLIGSEGKRITATEATRQMQDALQKVLDEYNAET